MALLHSRCPACARKGKDTSQDNLITYPDGHSHCYSCGYHTHAGTRERIMAQQIATVSEIFFQLPEDFEFTIPEVPLAWVKKYLTDEQIKFNNIGYSDEKKMLIFPYFDAGGAVLAWQGRYFGSIPNHPKWYSQGPLHEVLYILEPKDKRNIDGHTIVLVEDILSAIKVSEVQTAMPVFGSVISTKLLTRLRFLGYNNIIVWLDPDKRKEAVKFTLLARSIGLSGSPIFTDMDPKEFSTDKIRFMLD